MAIISKLPDEPNDEEGISAEELKTRFDLGGQRLKEYINETLIPDIGSELTALEQSAAAKLEERAMAAGNMPAGGEAGQLLVKKTGADFDTEFLDAVDAVSGETLTVSQSVKSALGLGGDARLDDALGVLSERTAADRTLRILTCATAAADAAKTAECVDFALTIGMTVTVLFDNANAAENPTLNINGTGAYPMKYMGCTFNGALDAFQPASLAAGMPLLLMFDGEAWQLHSVARLRKTMRGLVLTHSSSYTTYELGWMPKRVSLGANVNDYADSRKVRHLYETPTPVSAVSFSFNSGVGGITSQIYMNINETSLGLRLYNGSAVADILLEG
jgi:hypothetical protein